MREYLIKRNTKSLYHKQRINLQLLLLYHINSINHMIQYLFLQSRIAVFLSQNGVSFVRNLSDLKKTQKHSHKTNRFYPIYHVTACISSTRRNGVLHIISSEETAYHQTEAEERLQFIHGYAVMIYKRNALDDMPNLASLRFG